MCCMAQIIVLYGSTVASFRWSVTEILLIDPAKMREILKPYIGHYLTDRHIG